MRNVPRPSLPRGRGRKPTSRLLAMGLYANPNSLMSASIARPPRSCASSTIAAEERSYGGSKRSCRYADTLVPLLVEEPAGVLGGWIGQLALRLVEAGAQLVDQ